MRAGACPGLTLQPRQCKCRATIQKTTCGPAGDKGNWLGVGILVPFAVVGRFAGWGDSRHGWRRAWGESHQPVERFAPRGKDPGRPLLGRAADCWTIGSMPRAPNSLLTRFPEITTRKLAAARAATSRFWPKHTSVVLGPDDYALEMNRVVLGHVAVTFVACTSRIRVVSAAPATEYAVYMPLEGDIQVVADGVEMTASAGRPLLRGPSRTFVFEPSPIRCLVVDIPAFVMAAAAGPERQLPGHLSIPAPAAASLRGLAVRLATAADRSQTLAALQRFSSRDRVARLPDRLRRLEQEFVALVVTAATHGPGAGDGCDVGALKRWLASHAHRRVRVAELASRAGVSQRTVERAFLRTGCTPLAYVRRIRLDRARTMLTGPVKDVTVADVAAAVGYRHLGRFADEYRRHVGETPSRTLARGRSANRFRGEDED